MNIQDLQELLKSLETAKELSMASIANEVQKLKDDKDNLKKDLENVLLQIVDKVDSIPLNEEIGKLNDKLRGEISKLNEASEKKIKSIEDNIKKITADLIIQIESKIPETIKETIIEKVNEVKLDESPEDIAKKLNTLDSAIDAKVIKGLEDSIDASKIKNLKDLLPKNPPMYAGGSGASFLKSLRDVNLTGLTKDSEGKYLLGSGGGGASLTVTEGDASPSVSNVDTIVFPNGTVTDDGGGQVTISISGSGDVTASSNFGTDNVLIKSDGTGKGVQATGISVADTTNNVSGIGTLTSSGGTLTIDETASLSDYAQNSDIGTTIQAYDAGLNDISGLAVTDGNIIVGNGTNWVAESGATARTSLGLGTGNSPTFAGLTSDSLTLNGLTGGRGVYLNGSNQLVSANVSNTEIDYLSGVTSSIQTQLDTKAPLASPTFTGTVTVPATLNFASNGSIVKSGNHALTLTTTAATNVTFPTTGTLSTLAGTETLANKTLTTPRFADLGYIADSNGNEMLVFDSVTSAINHFTITNSIFSNGPELKASGDDTNIDMFLVPKGTGLVNIANGFTGSGVAVAATVSAGTSSSRLITPSALAGSIFGTKEVIIPVFLYDYAVTTGDGKVYVTLPSTLNGMNLVDVRANLGVAPSTSGTPTIQIARGRRASATSALSFVDVLSTRITIDANEYDSKDATTSAVINTANDDIATGDVYRIDMDVAGTGTKGLDIICLFRLP